VDVIERFETTPVVTSDATAEEWDAFVRAQPEATGYHLWRWREVFEQGLGQETCYFVARQNGSVVGVLPAVRMRSRVFGNAMSSLPYVNYGGVLAASNEAARALVNHASCVVRDFGLSYLVLRHRQRRFSDLPIRAHKQTMLLPLSATVDDMWKQLDRKVRNQIRKAEKSSLTVVSGGLELVDEFYSVFAHNMRDLGTPVYGRKLFAAMARAFPSAVRVHIVRLESVAVATAISYRYGSVVEVPSASSLREHRTLCPNHLLYWELIRTAIAQGLTTLDFGRSTPADGTWHFKQQWGAVPEQLEWEYVLGRGKQLPTTDRHNPRYSLAIAAWKRLPVVVTTILGPRLARVVP
jgi:FemAB-related protein (PEP-CTERM system-associated)